MRKVKRFKGLTRLPRKTHFMAQGLSLSLFWLWTGTNAVHLNTVGVSPIEVLKCG